MSSQITEAFRQQFADNFMHVAQQSESRLEKAVTLIDDVVYYRHLTGLVCRFSCRFWCIRVTPKKLRQFIQHSLPVTLIFKYACIGKAINLDRHSLHLVLIVGLL